LEELIENSSSIHLAQQLELSDIDMIELQIDSIAMVEGEMKEISEAEMVEAIKFAHEHISTNSCTRKISKHLEKKKFVPTKEKEKMKPFTKSKSSII
jgi:polyribonucleotide nucleotidyltransferase